MIRLEQIQKCYRMGRERWVMALENISVQINKGEFAFIVGPSGSGKSTFLAIAGLLDLPTEGKVWFGDQDVTLLSDSQRTVIRSERCGFIFQFPSLIPTLTALENVILPKTISGRFSPQDENRGMELLERVGLTDKAGHLPYQLSGGEQRRVAMARALMNDPDVILADEPTGALDYENAETIMQVFTQLNKEGKTILMVTHDRELARYATRIIQIDKGHTV